jgi:hypothetical protein
MVAVGPVVVDIAYWGTITAAITVILCVRPLLARAMALRVGLATV